MSLPVEIWAEIYSFLHSIKSCKSLAMTCSGLYKIWAKIKHKFCWLKVNLIETADFYISESHPRLDHKVNYIFSDWKNEIFLLKLGSFGVWYVNNGFCWIKIPWTEFYVSKDLKIICDSEEDCKYCKLATSKYTVREYIDFCALLLKSEYIPVNLKEYIKGLELLLRRPANIVNIA